MPGSPPRAGSCRAPRSSISIPAGSNRRWTIAPRGRPSSGNPEIDPFLANAYDLSLEWYPAPGTLVSIAPFRKDVLSFVSSETINTVFNGNPFGIPDSLAISACGSTPGCGPDATWAFSVPVNSPGGEVNGVELNYEQPFRFLPGLLRNLGVQMNYT